jgi:hypothetical protein
MKRTHVVLLPVLVLAAAIIPNCSHAQTASTANPQATPYAVSARNADANDSDVFINHQAQTACP